MSKRGASDYITKDGIGSMQGQDDNPVQRATAAQLANRKIAQARGRSGVRHRPAQSSGFSTPGAATSQSFPPINGSPAVGNGSANASFGGFGSGSTGGSSGFNFNTGGSAINNPFAQQGAQSATNGASSGGLFNFGGGQTQTGSAFQFDGSQSQQPAPSMFGASQPQATSTFGGFGASQPTSTPSLFSTSTSQPASTGGFGGFGASPSAPATNSSNIFSGSFGQSAAPSTSTPAPAFGGFGQPVPAFGPTGGDSMMSTTPESSPQKKPGWNKDMSNGITNTDNNGAESPDRPPHVEQQDEDRANPFQNIQRAPPPTSTPKQAESKPASTPLFSFGKPAAPEKSPEPTKQQEQEKENRQPNLFTPEKQTSAENPAHPFASVQRMPSSQQPSLFQASTLSQVSKPKPASTPSLFASEPATTQPAASPAKSSLFNPSTTLSNFGKPSQSTPAEESAPEPVRIQWGKADTLSKPSQSIFSMPAQVPQPLQAPRSPPKTFAPAPSTSTQSTIFLQFLPEILREDNLPSPDPQRDLNTEEKKYWYQNLKIQRANQLFNQVYAKLPRGVDLSLIYNEYISLMGEIKKTTVGSRLGSLTATHGDVEGQRKYDQEQGRLPMDGTNKRKAAPPEEQEQEKRSKVNGDAPGSEAASKFQSIFESSAQKNNAFQGTSNIFAAPAATPVPAKTSNLFGQSTASAAPAASPAKSLFGASMAAPATQSINNIFGGAALATPAKAAEPNTSGLFSKEAAQPSASTSAASSSSGGFQFKPASSTSTDASKATTFGSFKPSFSSATSAPVGLPKFGGGSASGSFLTQFAKSAEETAKEAKKKAMLEDYDSDEETKEQWSARYDREQEEKKKKLAASTPSSFKFTPTSSVAGSNAGSGDEAEAKGISSFLVPPAANSIFSGISRTPSPVSAASPAGSVFDVPRSTTPGQLSKDNPFAALSRQASEKGDADDEEEDESADGDEQSLGGENTEVEEAEDGESTPKVNGVQKRVGPFEEDSEESQPATPKPAEERKDGLFGRVSRDPSFTGGDRTPLATTGANTSSLFSTSAPTQNIWTPKDPIKFANKDTSSEGEKETAKKPLFSFTPIGGSQSQQPVFSGLFSGTQGDSSTTSGVATPSNPFASIGKPTSKLGTGNSLLAPPSGTTSVFSTPGWNSRASSIAPSDMSGAESTAGEGEEPKPDAQIDIADLAQDKEGHEVIFESSKVKATRFDKADEENDRKEGWHVVGVGPILIRKQDETGVVSILMRTIPSGKVILNTRMSGVLKAETMKKRARIMIVTKAGAEPHLISFQTEDDCTAFVEACKANGAS